MCRPLFLKRTFCVEFYSFKKHVKCAKREHCLRAGIPSWVYSLKIYEILDIPLDSVMQANPFLQTQTTRRKKCQIDFLIQTKGETLYVCEIKFKKVPLNSEVINEVKKKIERLKRPKYMSCRPVLIQVNGVSESVKNSDYFVKMIDFGELLS